MRFARIDWFVFWFLASAGVCAYKGWWWAVGLLVGVVVVVKAWDAVRPAPRADDRDEVW